MKKEEFKKLGKKWERLNKEYDKEIQDFFDDPQPDSLSSSEIARLERKQKELAELEEQWFEVAKGKVDLEE